MSEQILLASGLEGAFLGIGRRCGQPDLAIYSIPKAIRILVTRDGMSEEAAREYLEFNSIGAWMGTHTPVWVEVMSLDQLHHLVDPGTVH